MAQITLTSEHLEFVSSQLSTYFKADMSTMIEELINKLVPVLIQSTHAELVNRIESVESENSTLRERVQQLELEADRAQQYSRRNCLRVSGLPEAQSENTDDIILDMAKAAGANLSLEEIDRSHRVGKPKAPNARPRDIIVKFISYRARQKLYKKRAALRAVNNYKRSYINEDLTKKRSSLLYAARQLAKQHVILSTWSSDGTVLVKNREDRIHVINSEEDLTYFQPQTYSMQWSRLLSKSVLADK